MAQKKSQSLLSSYRKKSRKNSSKALLLILVAILVIAGLVMLALWATGNLGGGGGLQLFATDTPTPTMTLTPTPVTPTNTATVTPTITETPTPSLTPTLDGPFDYVVQEDDFYCAQIAEKFGADLEVFLSINPDYVTGGNCYIKAGDIVKVPAPWQRMPTSTSVPTDTRPGTVVDYLVEAGATLDSVALFFRSTPERIIAETNRFRTAEGITPLLSDTTPLFIGELLKVPVNIATPIPSATATRTMTPSPTP